MICTWKDVKSHLGKSTWTTSINLQLNLWKFPNLTFREPWANALPLPIKVKGMETMLSMSYLYMCKLLVKKWLSELRFLHKLVDLTKSSSVQVICIKLFVTCTDDNLVKYRSLCNSLSFKNHFFLLSSMAN